jgi:hypothetical protein
MKIKLALVSREFLPSRKRGGEAGHSTYVTFGLVGTSSYLLNANITSRTDLGLLSGKQEPIARRPTYLGLQVPPGLWLQLSSWLRTPMVLSKLNMPYPLLSITLSTASSKLNQSSSCTGVMNVSSLEL